MRFGSLFSGIGGLDLGLERAGMECAWQVEIDEWCRRVLARHWPDVPRWDDAATFPPADSDDWWGELGRQQSTEGMGEPRGMVDLICGGFPCQPVSHAGKRLAQADERWLWPEFARIVRVLRPRYVLVENVPGLLSRGMGDVLGDLAASGYDCEWDCIPAAAFGAPHLRYRVFIVAHASSEGLERQYDAVRAQGERRSNSGYFGSPPRSDRGVRWWTTEPDVRGVVDGVSEGLDGGVDGGHRMDSVGGTSCESEDCLRAMWDAWSQTRTASQGRGSDAQLVRELAHTLSIVPHPHPLGERQASVEAARFVRGVRAACSSLGVVQHALEPCAAAWFALSPQDQAWVRMAVGGGSFVNEWPDVPRMAHGVPSRVDRLRGLGNAVVPQVAEWIGRRLMEAA